MLFDNHDDRIRYYELLLERKELHGIPVYTLPEGFRFVFYTPGDRDIWIEIEQSAKEFRNYEEGINAWKRYFEGKDSELIHRMVFIETTNGEKVATATAFYDIYGRDQSGAGWLHWVAVRRDYQGCGLSKPLISYVLHLMTKLGYTHAKIPTQTNTWVACKIYLDFGFVPIPENAVNSYEGWQIVKTLTDHRSLSTFDSMDVSDILK